MSASCILSLMIIGVWLMPQCAFGQIPTACADDESLKNLRCCPTTSDGVCGEDANRGQCVELNVNGYSTNTTNVRDNWPHYFTHVCRCNGNYSGYDCSRCKFGHYGPDCSQSQVLPRRSVASYSDAEWEEFIEIIQLLRSHDSGYTVILEESFPGDSNLLMTNITFYKLYVWLHHYAAKDSSDFSPATDASQIDYAHFGPTFPTWHRYFNLWLEWEIQYMLQRTGHNNYHSFRLPYWDWRGEIQRSSSGMPAEELFTESRFGATRNVNGFPHVVGDIVGPNGWNDTLCTRLKSQICDPNIEFGPLQRCPFTGTNPCHSSNPDWPTINQVNKAISLSTYDSPPYNVLSKTGFRPFVDFDIHDDLEECRNDRMCLCFPYGGSDCNVTAIPSNVSVSAYSSEMHTDGHIIVAVGDFSVDIPSEMHGNMGDTGASPNDPYFIVHHTMIDCVFDEWLKRHPDVEYPNVPLTSTTRGHRPHSFMIPFYPLYTNADMFKPAASNFGYFCNLPEDVGSGSSPKACLPACILLTWWSVIFLSVILLY